MDSRTLGWALVLALALWSCKPPAEERAEAPPETDVDVDDVAAVRAVAESWDPMMNGGDLDGMMSLFAEDAVRLDPELPIAAGTDAIRARFEAEFGESSFDSSNPVDEIRVDGHWAFARGSFRDRATSKEGGETTETTGNWVSIFRKTPGGWKYAVDIWNRDTPPSPEAESNRLEATAVEVPDLPPLPGGAEADALRALTSSWDEAVANGDVEALAAFYTDDARRMDPDEPAHIGREAIRTSFEAELGTTPAKPENTILGMEVGKEWAYRWGTWSVEGTKDRGKWLSISRRTPGGWKDYIDIWNRD